MSNKIVGLKYVDTALPTGTIVVVLFNTAPIAATALGQTLAKQGSCPMANWAPMNGLHAYHANVKNSHDFTIKGYKSIDRGVTWVQFYTSGVLAAPAAGATNDVVVSVEGTPDFAFTVLNGGTNQTAFDITQNLSDVP